ncbi:carbohydrate esterase family 16 protein [Scleroderma yunnanense]
MYIPVTLLYPLLTFYGFHSLLFEVLRHFLPLLYPGTYKPEVHLAIQPHCGPLSGNFFDVNAGLDMTKYRTIVSFGDSYTDGGRHDGGYLSPAVVIPPNAFAGGRSTNGKVWVEHLADRIGARLMDYAWSSAVTNITLWPDNPFPRDFIMQTTLFLEQSHHLDPETTLYTIFFGINDWEDSFIDGNNLLQAAASLLSQIALLSQPPTNARNFLVTDVYGRGRHNDWGEAWVQAIFDGLVEFHTRSSPRLNVAFANFATIWDGVLGPDPGYDAFGYVSTEACNPGITTANTCSDPDHSFYWFYGHPSAVTNRIMADYVNEVLEWCRVP